MNDSIQPFKKVSGHFFRAVTVDKIDRVLAPPDPASAGRYHRPGETMLYTSAALEWAVMAIAGYMREDRRPRVVVPLLIGEAMVVDQHDEAACRLLGINRELSNEPWRSALAAGQEPVSWRNVAIARAANADGIIDRSRMIPAGWHLNLFRWNDLGGPSVQVCGDPVEIKLSADGTKWGL